MNPALYPLLSAAFYGLGYIFLERVVKAVPISVYWIYSSLLWLFIVIAACVFFRLPMSITPLWNNKDIFLFAVLCTVCNSVAYFFTVVTTQKISASYAAVGEVTYPLFTIMLLFLFFGVRHFDWTLLVGAVLIVAGSFILVSGQLHNKP